MLEWVYDTYPEIRDAMQNPNRIPDVPLSTYIPEEVILVCTLADGEGTQTITCTVVVSKQKEDDSDDDFLPEPNRNPSPMKKNKKL